MPCNGGNYFHTPTVRDPEDRRTVDHLTRMLCQALALLDEAHNSDMPAELNEWWYEHRLKDEERTIEAKRRADAQTAKARRSDYLDSVKMRMVDQMTDDEREALGLPRRAP